MLLSNKFEIMEKLYSSKTALKEYGGGMHHSSFHAEIVIYYNCMPFCKNLF